mgnify:CR=1 FL=1
MHHDESDADVPTDPKKISTLSSRSDTSDVFRIHRVRSKTRKLIEIRPHEPHSVRIAGPSFEILDADLNEIHTIDGPAAGGIEYNRWRGALPPGNNFFIGNPKQFDWAFTIIRSQLFRDALIRNGWSSPKLPNSPSARYAHTTSG